MKLINEHLDGLQPFDLRVECVEQNFTTHKSGIDSHVHPECEIYINLSGDVSLVVEGSIYPVKSGDVIITRPFEYHHCVYHSSSPHRHFWILFSPKGNERLLDLFYKRNAGDGNLLLLSPENAESLISLCYSMLDSGNSEYAKYSNFFTMLDILNTADRKSNEENDCPHGVKLAVNYINDNFMFDIKVSDIARASSVSVNTLERHFQAFFGISPSSYVRKKRLANALRLLSCGANVTEASEKSGFPDYSAFIALFKRTYGITPLQYRKRFNKP